MSPLRLASLIAVGLAGSVACRPGGAPPARPVAAPPVLAPGRPGPPARLADLPLPAGAARRLGGAQLRQSGRIKLVAVSPDGRLVATGATDGSLRVWSATDGAELHASFVKGHVYGVMGLAFRPGRGELLAAADPKVIRVIATTTWETTREIPVRCAPDAIAVAPDGATVAVACGHALWLHPLDGGDPVAVAGVTRPDALSWSGDGALLAVRFHGGIDVVDVARRAVIDTIRREHLMVTEMEFAPRGSLLAYADFHGSAVRLYDVAARREVASFESILGASALGWSASGDTLAFARDQLPAEVDVVDVRTGGRRTLHPPNQTILALAFSPRGPLWLATDHAARAWDVAADASILGPEGHSATVRALAYRPDGRVLASGADDGTIRLWDLVRGGHRVLERRAGGGAWRGDVPAAAGLVQHEVAGLAFLDHDRLIAADGTRSTGVVRVWSTGRERVLAGARVQDEGVAGLALAPDGRTAWVVGREDEESPLVAPDPFLTSLRLVDPTTLATRRALPVGDGSHTLTSECAVSASRDGSRVAVTTDGVVEIRDAAGGAVLRAFDGAQSRVAMGPGGDLAAVSTGPIVDLWSGDEPEPRAGWRLGSLDDDVTALAFSPDGASIAAGDSAGGIHVIDVATTDEPRATWAGHRGPVRAVVVAPDGRTFASAGDDGQILVWPLVP